MYVGLPLVMVEVVATATHDLMIYGQRFVGMTCFLSQRHSRGELGDVFRLLCVPGSTDRADSCLAMCIDISQANAQVACTA